MNRVNLNDIKSLRNTMEDSETVINYIRRDSYITVYTSDNTMLSRLKRIAAKNPAIEIYEMSYYEGRPTGYTFIMPKKCLSIRTGLPKVKKDKEDIDETSED